MQDASLPATLAGRLADRLLDPATPAADLPALAKTIATLDTSAIFNSLAPALMTTMEAFTSLCDARRDAEAEAERDRQEFRRERRAELSQVKKLEAEIRRLKKAAKVAP